jgi:hypothetical protein
MRRRSAFTLGLVAAACLVVEASTGCGNGGSRPCEGVCGAPPGAACSSQYPSNDCLEGVCCILDAHSGPPYFDDAGSCPSNTCASPDDIGCASWFRSSQCPPGDLCCVIPDGGAAAPSTCKWPTSLDDAGPGACGVGRAYVKCTYPSGVSCEGGVGASSPGGLTMLCISEDPTSCSGCESISGPPTCTNMCAPNEYAVSCGGPPRFSSDGGFDNFAYQQAPANCVGVGGTPAGNLYSCCPCE